MSKISVHFTHTYLLCDMSS